MTDLKIYVIIPTRNRHDTLGYAIQTCTQQNYDNLEIIVSDNCSGPETAAVVSAIADPRVKFQRSDKPLSMRDSWEFAISGIKEEGFVHVMGDDNGLLPGALDRVTAVARDTGAHAIHGQVVQYVWPDIQGHSSRIHVPLPRHGIKVNAGRALKNAYRLHIGWDKLPNINMGFIHTSLIAKVRAFSQGRYFAAAIPDVYSAVANAMCVDSYVYLNHAFAVNGASRQSNGMAGGTKGKMTFTADTLASGYRFHPKYPVNESYHMGTYEAFMVAADNAAAGLGQKFILDAAVVFRKAIKNEYVFFRRHWVADELRQFAILNGLKPDLPDLEPSHIERDGRRKWIERVGDSIAFGCDLVAIRNVLEASQFAAKIIDNPDTLPDTLLRRPIRARLKSALLEHMMMGGTALPEDR